MFYITGDTHRDFKRTAAFCDTVESTTDDSRWYCGHHHTDKTDNRLRFMFEDFLEVAQ